MLIHSLFSFLAVHFETFSSDSHFVQRDWLYVYIYLYNCTGFKEDEFYKPDKFSCNKFGTLYIVKAKVAVNLAYMRFFKTLILYNVQCEKDLCTAFILGIL